MLINRHPEQFMKLEPLASYPGSSNANKSKVRQPPRLLLTNHSGHDAIKPTAFLKFGKAAAFNDVYPPAAIPAPKLKKGIGSPVQG